jgi:hypothetical protein
VGGENVKNVKLMESLIYKVFYHEGDEDQKSYWLLCKKERIGVHWYWKILRKINYISSDGTIYDM